MSGRDDNDLVSMGQDGPGWSRCVDEFRQESRPMVDVVGTGGLLGDWP